MKKKSKVEARFHFGMPAEDYETYKKIADSYGINRSELGRRLVKALISGKIKIPKG